MPGKTGIGGIIMGEQTVFLAENKPRILEIYAKRKEKSS